MKNNLNEKVNDLRRQIMDICYRTQAGHPSSALSCLDIMVSLFYGGYTHFDLTKKQPDRDRFILSKGHASIALYVILADLGLIESGELYHYCKAGSFLGGHINSLLVPGTEFSAGSLGHGLSYGIGQALNQKILKNEGKIYVLLGDGECQEGSVWEAAICAAHHKLDNLVVIIDHNKLQGSGFVKDISDLSPLDEKWKAFGFEVSQINGHDIRSIYDALNEPSIDKKPKAVIAHTIKGNGVALMAGKNNWHSRRPNDDEWKIIRQQIAIE